VWRWLLVLVVLLAAAAGVIVGWLNPGEVSVDLLIASFAVPLGVLMLGCVAAGAGAGLIVGMLLAWTGGRRKRKAKGSGGKGNAGRAEVISPVPASHD